jgi:hypothetical protein
VTGQDGLLFDALSACWVVAALQAVEPVCSRMHTLTNSPYGAIAVADAFQLSLLHLSCIQHNFTLVVLGIVAVSVLPVILEVMAARRGGHGHGDPGAAAGGTA